MTNQQNITSIFGENQEAASQALDQFVSKGMKLLYSEDTIENILSVLSSDPNPITSISKVAVGIIQRLDSSIRESGDEVPDAIKLEGSIDLINQIADIGMQSGALKKVTPAQVQAAISLTIQDYLKEEIRAGRIDPQELASQLSQGISQMSPEEQEQINNESLKIHDTIMKTEEMSTRKMSEEGGLIRG